MFKFLLLSILVFCFSVFLGMLTSWVLVSLGCPVDVALALTALVSFFSSFIGFGYLFESDFRP